METDNNFQIKVLLAQTTPPPQDGAPAGTQTTTGKAPGQQVAAPQQGPGQMLMFTVIMMVVFYIILIRPQQKKVKAHENLLKTLNKGDKILTSGGLVASVITIKGDTVSIRCAESKLEIRKSNIAEVLEKASSAGQALLDEADDKEESSKK